MSKITLISIQQNNKSRCNLFVDGEFFAGVTLESVMKYRLKIGQEIEPNKLKELLDESEKEQALAKALTFVSKTLKTKKQVKEYLLKKGYSEDVVWYCIDKLKEYSYIDDKEYSRRYIESVSKNQGQRLVEYKLMAKGVKKDDISFAFDNCEIDANENARNVVHKYLKNKELTKENLAKAYRYLLNRGFSYDQASYAIKNFEKED